MSTPTKVMSKHKETRRTFIKGSMAKGLVAVNTGVLAGLINTPGVVHAEDETTDPGTTQPGTTQPTGTIPPGYKSVKDTETFEVTETSAPQSNQPTPQQKEEFKDQTEQNHPEGGPPPSGAKKSDTDYKLVPSDATQTGVSHSNNDSIDNAPVNVVNESGNYKMKITFTVIKTYHYSSD